MNMPSVIKERLAAGKIVRTMHVVGYATPRMIELFGTLGNFHGFWFDQEHSAIPHHELEMMLIACRAAGMDAFARVPPTDYATVMRPMEAGCSGVMIAQVRTLDEVEQAVAWAKYPPVGVRGMFSGNAETQFGKIDMADARCRGESRSLGVDSNRNAGSGRDCGQDRGRRRASIGCSSGRPICR